MTMTSQLRAAADAIRDGEALLICTGAGMGVDSGLGTFRGRNAGVWPPLKALKLDYMDICDADWFDVDPCLAWAFWHSCFTAYCKGSPHKGYEILANWGQGMEYGLFSATSNIDGHWARTENVGEQRVYECHGSVTHMQCVPDEETTGAMMARVWRTDPEEIAQMDLPVWDLSPGEHVEVLPRHPQTFGALGHIVEDDVDENEWLPAAVAADGCSIVGADGSEIAVGAVRRPGGVDLTRVPEAKALPRCPQTQQAARPNVLMFGDMQVSFRRIDEQQRRLTAWMDALPRDVRLVVVEVGAGTTIPTMRQLAERTVREFPASVLVRVNLDEAHVPPDLEEEGRAVGLGMLGALTALTALDEAVDEVQMGEGSEEGEEEEEEEEGAEEEEGRGDAGAGGHIVLEQSRGGSEGVEEDGVCEGLSGCYPVCNVHVLGLGCEANSGAMAAFEVAGSDPEAAGEGWAPVWGGALATGSHGGAESSEMQFEDDLRGVSEQRGAGLGEVLEPQDPFPVLR